MGKLCLKQPVSGTACLLASVVLAAFALSGCNQTSGSSAPVAAAASKPLAPPNWPKLPDGAACTNDLTRYQAVLDADVRTGNVNRSVYDQIEAELVPAANACAAGHNSEALAMIRSAKIKHGYRANA
jgi:predicted small secreted protein